MTKVEDIGFESGQQTLCRFKFQLDAAAPTIEDWHHTGLVSEEGHCVTTSMEDVSDGDMQLANLTATIITMEGGHNTNAFTGMSSLSSTVPRAGDFNVFHAQTKRIIREAPLIAHQFRTHIKTHDMKKLDEVIGV